MAIYAVVCDQQWAIPEFNTILRPSVPRHQEHIRTRHGYVFNRFLMKIVMMNINQSVREWWRGVVKCDRASTFISNNRRGRDSEGVDTRRGTKRTLPSSSPCTTRGWLSAVASCPKRAVQSVLHSQARRRLLLKCVEESARHARASLTGGIGTCTVVVR
jgi:hypothetical protein